MQSDIPQPAPERPVPRRLLVVEDEPLMSELLSEALVAAHFDVRTAPDALAAREQVERFDPDAVLLDISLGDGPTGLDLGHVLHRTRPDIALLFLTKHPDNRIGGAGAPDLPPNCGFLRKDKVRDTRHLIEAINTVLADRANLVRQDRDDQPLAGLTAKQFDVLRRISLGMTNGAIAREMGVAESSVERWVVSIFKTLGIESNGSLNPRVEAVRRFITVVGIPQRS